MATKENDITYELFEIYHDSLISHCLLKGCTEHDAEEFVSETFLRLVKNIDKVKDRHLKEQRSWLYSTVENVIFEHKYKNRHMDKINTTVPEDLSINEEAFDKIIDKSAYTKMMDDVYIRLSDEDKVFLDDYVQGKISCSEIAKAENKNYNTVKSQIRRRLEPIKNILKIVMKEHGIEVADLADKNKKKSGKLK